MIFDFKDLKAIDTAGVRFFLALENDLKNKNIKITKEGLNSRFQTLFELCEKLPKTRQNKNHIKISVNTLSILEN